MPPDLKHKPLQKTGGAFLWVKLDRLFYIISFYGNRRNRKIEPVLDFHVRTDAVHEIINRLVQPRRENMMWAAAGISMDEIIGGESRTRVV